MNDSEWGAGWVQSLAGSREVSQHSSDFHTLEPGGGGGGSLTGDFGGSCFPGKGHLSPGTKPGGVAEEGEERHRAWVHWGYFISLPPPVGCVRMAAVRSRLAGEIMQVESQDKTQAGVSPRAPSVPPAAASAGRRALKLAVPGGAGGTGRRWGAWGAQGPSHPRSGVWSITLGMGL